MRALFSLTPIAEFTAKHRASPEKIRLQLPGRDLDPMRRRHSFGQNSPKLWRRACARQTDAKSIPIEAKLLSAAAALEAMVGVGSIAVGEGGTHRIVSAANSLAANAGMVRAHTPRRRDYWAGCDAARAMGTAPNYRGEPGYRSGMDGDGDGIACEPYRGN